MYANAYIKTDAELKVLQGWIDDIPLGQESRTGYGDTSIDHSVGDLMLALCKSHTGGGGKSAATRGSNT